MVFTLPRGVTPVSHRKLSALAMEGYGVVMVTVPAKQTSAIPPLHRELQTEMRGPTSTSSPLCGCLFPSCSSAGGVAGNSAESAPQFPRRGNKTNVLCMGI